MPTTCTIDVDNSIKIITITVSPYLAREMLNKGFVDKTENPSKFRAKDWDSFWKEMRRRAREWG